MAELKVSPKKQEVTSQWEGNRLLTQDGEYRDKFLDIIYRFFSATNLDDVLIDLMDDITALFNAERLTVYVIDALTKELVSRIKSGNELNEIRVPLSCSSLSGYAAFKGALLNIKNVYDTEELASIDPVLEFDRSWDQKTGFRTRQVLVGPISFQKFLLGVVQIINCKDGAAFTERDESALQDLVKTLGIAIYNQKRMAKARPAGLDYLAENGLLAHTGRKVMSEELLSGYFNKWLLPKGGAWAPRKRFYHA